MNKYVIKNTILIQAVIFLSFAILYAIDGNLDKWFDRWSLGMVLLALYGVMVHLDKED